MKVIWHKWSEEIPTCKHIYLTDGEKIWLKPTSSIDWENKLPEIRWAEAIIFYPDLPEKEAHLCTKNGWICIELDAEGAFLELHSPHRRDICVVQVCPFCGWYPEEK